MQNDKGFYDMHQPMSKTQPAKLSDRERDGQATDATYNGDGYPFAIKDKVTKMGGNYADVGPGSSASGNFSDKDASDERLIARNKQGQEVCSYTATTKYSTIKTGTGGTAYDGKPIPEVYIPATSHGHIDPNAVEYNTDKKNRNTK